MRSGRRTGLMAPQECAAKIFRAINGDFDDNAR